MTLREDPGVLPHNGEPLCTNLMLAAAVDHEWHLHIDIRPGTVARAQGQGL